MRPLSQGAGAGSRRVGSMRIPASDSGGGLERLLERFFAAENARDWAAYVVTTPTGSVTLCAPEALRPASRPEGAGRDPARTIKICINSGTRSKSYADRQKVQLKLETVIFQVL